MTWLVGSMGWCSWEHLKTEKLWVGGGKTISTVPSVPSSNSKMVSTRHYHRLKQVAIRKNMPKQQAGINSIKYGDA